MSRLSKDSTPVLRATAISGEPTVLLPLPFVRTREGTLVLSLSVGRVEVDRIAGRYFK